MAVRRKRLGAATDGSQLGASLYELPPGGESWPYHYHTANEEAMYVLSGTGTLRLADESVAIDAGDYVTFPADETGAHELRNDGTEPLRYLLVSTMLEPDVTVYPDSEKVGVFVGSPPGGQGDRSLYGYYEIDSDVSYWE
ncbi:cupin domain-containing protein [Halovivax gelatinilyticus]|uniref:cupin domain-containing protein n=1 Tax=Halovivax gelatinilyticus TaxID=2961597 RepID=UPI0020CA67A4|nr:cupin domain-containing protein [Halovivax gelatinilyticus]